MLVCKWHEDSTTYNPLYVSSSLGLQMNDAVWKQLDRNDLVVLASGHSILNLKLNTDYCAKQLRKKPKTKHYTAVQYSSTYFNNNIIFQ